MLTNDIQKDQHKSSQIDLNPSTIQSSADLFGTSQTPQVPRARSFAKKKAEIPEFPSKFHPKFAERSKKTHPNLTFHPDLPTRSDILKDSWLPPRSRLL